MRYPARGTQRELLVGTPGYQATFTKVVDGSAAATTAETLVFRAPFAGTVRAAYFVPDAALTANDTNFASLLVDKRPASAPGTPANVATLTTEVASGSWVAWTAVSLGTLSNEDFEAGDVFTFEITKDGTGVVVPDGVLVLDYDPRDV